MSQTKIGKNVDKFNNIESRILTGNYRQVSVQYYCGLKLPKDSDKMSST